VFDSPKAAEDAPTEAAAHGPSKTPEQMAAMLEALKSSKVPPKSELFEVSFFSLSTSRVSKPYYAEAGLNGYIIRDYNNGQFLRAIHLKVIQRYSCTCPR